MSILDRVTSNLSNILGKGPPGPPGGHNMSWNSGHDRAHGGEGPRGFPRGPAAPMPPGFNRPDANGPLPGPESGRGNAGHGVDRPGTGYGDRPAHGLPPPLSAPPGLERPSGHTVPPGLDRPGGNDWRSPHGHPGQGHGPERPGPQFPGQLIRDVLGVPRPAPAAPPGPVPAQAQSSHPLGMTHPAGVHPSGQGAMASVSPGAANAALHGAAAQPSMAAPVAQGALAQSAIAVPAAQGAAGQPAVAPPAAQSAQAMAAQASLPLPAAATPRGDPAVQASQVPGARAETAATPVALRPESAAPRPQDAGLDPERRALGGRPADLDRVALDDAPDTDPGGQVGTESGGYTGEER